MLNAFLFLKIGLDWPNWQCCLAGSSKRAPRILIFSIAMGAEYLFYMKSIETHARAFLALIILGIGTVLIIKRILSRDNKQTFELRFSV